MYRYNEFARMFGGAATNLSLGGDYINQIPLPESSVKVPDEMIAS